MVSLRHVGPHAKDRYLGRCLRPRKQPRVDYRLRKVFESQLGKERVVDAEQVMGGEDFSQYGLAGVPILMYRLGVVSPARIERMEKLGQPLPTLHSPEFYPDLEGTLETGISSLVLAALDLLR